MESDLLDSVIGIVFVWFLLSATLSLLGEGLALLTRTRAKNLWLGISRLVDPNGCEALSARMIDAGIRLPFRSRYDLRPQTASASGKSRRSARRRARRAGGTTAELRTRTQLLYDEMATQMMDVATPGRLSKATNVPSESFSEAVVSLATSVKAEDLVAAARDAGWTPRSRQELELALRGTAGSPLLAGNVTRLGRADGFATSEELGELYRVAASAVSGRDVAAYLDNNPPMACAVERVAVAVPAHQRVAAVRATIESWFDREMGLLSALYRRQSRKILGVLAVPLVLFTHSDALATFDDLRHDASLRQAAVAAAVSGAAEESVANAIEAGCALSTTTSESTAESSESTAESTAESTGTTSSTTTTQAPTALAEASGQFRCASRIIEGATSFRVGLAWQALISAGEGDDSRLEPGDAWPYIHRAITVEWGWVGRAITLLALLFGAQFWYDILRRLTGLRGTRKAG